MIIVFKPKVNTDEINKITNMIKEKGLSTHIIEGTTNIICGVIGDTTDLDPYLIQANSCVDQVLHVSKSYKLAHRQEYIDESVIDVDGVKVGGGHLALIAGPCSIESKEQIRIAKIAKEAGANMLRGGAFKPRTSPYSFQGLGLEGLEYLLAAKKETGLPIVSELVSSEYIEIFNEKVDLVQIGTRNMQNYELLKEVGKRCKKPILLKRGLSATYEEWIMAAEYIMSYGNKNVILCERGIRTFEQYTRNTLDLSVIPILKDKTHLPIIIDPSHATGDWKLVESMSLAAIAAGADGLIIEVHDHPECALSDGAQSLKPAKLELKGVGSSEYPLTFAN